VAGISSLTPTAHSTTYTNKYDQPSHLLNFRTLPYTNVRFNYNTSHLFKTMGSTTPVVKPSPDSNSPMMMLPDPAVGIIDLATLKDIHRFLNQSGLQDDRELAAWVQQNFLYEPITSVGREIRTTESFSQLDRAYRRARSLTNKTQDKWPFFSRDWKEMPPATVRNNARGEAAPGVALPGMTGAMHDSPMSDSQPTQTCESPRAATTFDPPY
jgi:hypothetical protein